LISRVDKTTAVIVSTIIEAWELVKDGLVVDGTVKDVSREDSDSTVRR
jgi:D-serine ammonia-lyase